MAESDIGLSNLSHEAFEALLSQRFDQAQIPIDFQLVSTNKIIDSTNASFPDWAHIGRIVEQNYSDYDGMIVISGTDTIDYCSAALSFSFEGLAKPVIVTGSMLPLKNDRSDAMGNLITAFEAAVNPDLKGGVYTVFDKRVMSATHLVKTSDGFDGITTPHFSGMAVTTPEGLSLNHAAFGLFEKARVSEPASFVFRPIHGKKVSLYVINPTNADMIATSLNLVEKRDLDAVIIEGYGNGNLPDSEDLKKALIRISSHGTPIIIGTTVVGGRSNADYASGSWLDEIGALRTGTMTRAASFIKTHFLLGCTNSSQDFTSRWPVDYRGETISAPSIK